MPQISVIVPVYNTEKYIYRCVDSILSQTFVNYELILVDDGSTDKSGSICDKYSAQDNRISVIHQKNKGVSSARNYGLKKAKGEFIAFCDSDDYLHENWLQDLHDYMFENSVDLVSSGFTVVDENERINNYIIHKSIKQSFNAETDKIDFIVSNVLINGIGWEVWTKLFKREIISTNKIQFCETCENFAEDMGFVIEYLFYCDSVGVCKSTGYFYAIHNNSMMDKCKQQIKLNALNEVSKHIGKRYFLDLNPNKKNQKFAVIHFLIMYNQYIKIIGSENYPFLADEIKKITDLHWYRKYTREAFAAFGELNMYLGKSKAQQVLLLSSYCLHGSWKIHTYLSTLFYKIVYSGE